MIWPSSACFCADSSVARVSLVLVRSVQGNALHKRRPILPQNGVEHKLADSCGVFLLISSIPS